MQPEKLTMAADRVYNSRFLRACRREPVDATPIWLMRQAGRYMPEYMAIYREHDFHFLSMVKDPQVATEITMQPINAFEVDAAIIFADILPPLEGMGLDLDFVVGEGPVIHNPIRTERDVANLRTPPPKEALWFTLEAIKRTRQQLDPRGIPLIGFSGAPFTLAAYSIEGRGSRHYENVKRLMFEQPDAWHAMMQKFAHVTGHYMLAQAEAGAVALQLFDSWVGVLTPDDYRQYVQPYSRQALTIAAQAGVPLIHFGTDTSGMLTDVRDAGGDVIGVDWRIDIDVAARILGDEVGIQGNLDPITLLGAWEPIEQRAKAVLDRMAGRPDHIFNLGHGVLHTTPVENVKRLVEFVHDYSRR